MRHPVKNKAGFTLIEIAIYLTVLGILAGAIGNIYSDYVRQQAYDATQYKKNRVRQALNEFVIANNRFPCPARPDVAYTHSDAGVENCLGSTTGNTCDGEVCRINGARDAYYADRSQPDNDTSADPLLTGALPYKALGLNIRDTIDSWGSQLGYTVTEYATDEDTFSYDIGAIGYQYYDQDSSSWEPIKQRIPYANVIKIANAFLYSVVSYGEDQRGGYGINGTLIRSCDTSHSDGENCDKDGIFRDAEPSLAVRSLADNNEYFDDGFTLFEINRQTDTWRYAPESVFTKNMNNISGMKVGIGTATPEATVDVKGRMLSENLHARSYCGKNSSDEVHCFDPAIIGGAGDDCPRGYVKGIKDSRIICSNKIDPSNLTPSTCNSGERVKSIDSAGNLVCQ